MEIKKSVSQKYALPFIFFLLVLALIALIICSIRLSQTTGQFATASDNEIRSSRLVNELLETSLNSTRMAKNFVMKGNERYETAYNGLNDIRSGTQPRPINYDSTHYWDHFIFEGNKPNKDGKAISLSELMKNVGFTKDELVILAKAEEESKKLANIELEAIRTAKGILNTNGDFTVISNPDLEKARAQLFNNEYQSIEHEMTEQLSIFKEKVNKRVTDKIDAIKDELVLTEKILFGLLGLIALLVGALLFTVTKNQKQELLRRTAEKEKAEAENEKLNNSVINILHTMQALSQRDLTVKAPVTEDIIGTVSDSVNALTEETSNVLLDVTSVANQVEDVSAKVRNQAALVSQTAEAERVNVEEMKKILNQTLESMVQVSALAKNSNTSASKATEATNEALETVSDTVEEMDAIRQTISETEKRIKRLGERSQEISGIVGLINTISERTHVLALNASMQAAVAGEAGRGFAVVAEEVQRLAESSRSATEQIESLVKNIQIDTNETINTVNQTIAKVVQGSEKAQQAGEQMQETQQITAELVSLVEKIADSAEAQRVMSNQLIDSVKEIGDSTEMTARQIQEQNFETEQLQSAAKNLVDAVNVFKLPSKAA